MTDVLAIIFPIYCAIALGFGLVKFRAFSAADMRLMGKFVLNVSFPALIFHSVATRPLHEVLHTDYMLAYLLGGLAIILVSYLAFSIRGYDPLRRALAVMGSSCPNNGFVGYAVFLLAMPDMAAVILTLNLLVENVVFVPICLILLSATERSGDRSLLSQLAQILWNVLKMPMIVALLAGMLVAGVGLSLPAPIEKFTAILAATASGLGLVVIGGALADLPPGTRWRFALEVVVGKLLINPALTAAVAIGLMGLGVITLSPEFFAALILSSAMPIFGIYVLFAQRHNQGGLASLALFGSTLGAFVTLSLLLALLT